MLHRLIASIHPRMLPPMTRQSYRHELVTALTYPAVLALIEGGVIGIVAKRLFGVSEMLFAAIIASENFANLTSFLWARLSRGRSKIAVINLLQLTLILCVAAIGVLPVNDTGGFLLAGLVILSRCVQTGIITLRSTIWRQNYPPHLRARITSRFTLCNMVVMALVPLIAGSLLDADESMFRFIYPAGLIFGIIGVAAYSRIRIRGERELIKFEMRPDSVPQPHGERAPVYEYDPKSPRPTFWSVLKRDRLFRSYMLWQFVNGTAAMTGHTVVIYLIAQMTEGFGKDGYKIATLLSTTIPLLVAMATTPLWARLLDRMHIVEFRSRHGSVWVINQLANWLGAMLVSLPIIGVSRVFNGIARGGGALAWNLGHNDFADRRMVAIYMGIHVTLTGVRGAVAPFLAIILFSGRIDLSPWTIIKIPALNMGYHIFLVTAALSLWAEVGFHMLAKRVGAAKKH
jgi:hypothetical protein